MRLTPATSEFISEPALSVAGCHPFAGRPIPPLARYADSPLPSVGTSREALIPLASPIIGFAAYDGAKGPRGRYPSVARQTVVQRLTAAASLLPDGWQLVVLDTWRPRRFQEELVSYYGSTATELGFVSTVSNPNFIPPHVSGGAVDITLSAGAGPLALGTDFDSFTPTAHLTSLEAHESTDRTLRRILYWSLVSSGFAPYQQEWWHYSYGDQNWAIFAGQEQSLYGEATDSDVLETIT